LTGDGSRGWFSRRHHTHGLWGEVDVTNAKRAPDSRSHAASYVLA
jgi:hypothetical protein